MIGLYYIWILLLLLLLLIIGRGKKGGVLCLSYFLGLSLIHVPGLYVNSSISNSLINNIETEKGFIVTLYGMISFIVGSLLVKIIYQKNAVSIVKKYDYQKQSRYLFILGSMVYFFLMPVIYFIPSLTSLISPLTGLLTVAFFMHFYHSKIYNSKLHLLLGLVFLPILPLLTMFTSGFAGFGSYWVITIISFLYIIFKKRYFIIFGPIVGAFAISFSVSYFKERDALREKVWYQNSSFSDRLEVFEDMITNFELIDKDNSDHAKLIDERLNQNILIGQAIDLREKGITEQAMGSTIPLWVFIPRIVWPDKPNVGGSNTLVADYTGRTFVSGTSVGVGQSLEFYINFNTLGVIIGFFLYGIILMILDINIIHFLNEGNFIGIIKSSLVGIAMLQPGGSLMEVIIAVIGSFILSPIIARQISLKTFIGNFTSKDKKIKNQIINNWQITKN
jgi:hypothetical protein